MSIQLHLNSNKLMEVFIFRICIKLQNGPDVVCYLAYVFLISSVRWQVVNLDPKVAMRKRYLFERQIWWPSLQVAFYCPWANFFYSVSVLGLPELTNNHIFVSRFDLEILFEVPSRLQYRRDCSIINCFLSYEFTNKRNFVSS